jgi:DNA polymerase-3 subunit delta'
MAKRQTKKKPRTTTIELDPTPDAELLTPPLEVAFDDLIGQPRAVETLDAAVASGKVHHAWIFHGPQGVGKFTAAVAFAGLLLDPETGPDLTGRVRPDPDSRVQSLLRSGAHPDLHVIRKELARFSDDASVRNSKLTTISKDVLETRLLQPASRASNLAGGLASKVFIVDEAELLDRSTSNAVSQNALLKTLEEPPEGTVIILVTSNEDRLLPTIRSRSQRVAFGPLDDGSMRTWIDRREDLEPASLAGPSGEWLLAYAEGSPGRLLEALETGLASWHDTLAPALAKADRGEYDPLLAPAMHAMTDEWAKAWVARDDKRSKEAANRMALQRLFGMIAGHARTNLADPARASVALGMIDAITRAEKLLNSNVQPALVLEGLAADLPAGDRAVPV